MTDTLCVFPEDRRILELLKSTGFAPSHVCDAGASNGVWSLLSTAVFPDASYDLFEPLAESNRAYHASYTGNPKLVRLLERPDFRLHPMALGNTNGEVILHEYPNAAGSTTLPVGEFHANVPEGRSVPVMTLDHAIEHAIIPLPDLLKMDVQGFELAILEGAARHLDQISVILMECWLIRSYAFLTPLLSEIIAFLSPFGFELFDFGTQFRNPEGRLVSVDPCFVNTRMPAFKAHFRSNRGKAGLSNLVKPQ
jgi:FkbM family methyltransferase